MIWFKSCPRCRRGDMTFDEDGDRFCLQCGHAQRPVAAPALVAGFANLVDPGEQATKLIPVDSAHQEVILSI